MNQGKQTELNIVELANKTNTSEIRIDKELPQSASSSEWLPNGVTICTAANDQLYPQLISDGQGGAILAWQDYRSGSADIYAQKIDKNGKTMWNSNGLAICTKAGLQSNPLICSDGQGGAIIGWSDFSDGDIYVQRVNSSGSTKWTAGGVKVSSSGSASSPNLVSDGQGGAIIAWHAYFNYNDIFARRIDANGNLQWGGNKVICNAAYNQEDPVICNDGRGGAIMAWRDTRSSTYYDIYAQSINFTGSVKWTPNGTLICNSTNYQRDPRLISDGQGGAIITWDDARLGETNYNIYAQRIDFTGSVKWQKNGTVICNSTGNQQSPQLVSDGQGGVIITWYDARFGTDNIDIYAQRINFTGSVKWQKNGTAICSASDSQSSAMIVSDGQGGAIIAWQDSRSSSLDVYVQRIDSTGRLMWSENGIAICTASSSQSYQRLVSDGQGGAIIAWQDYRSGSADIYAQRIESNGFLPVEPVPAFFTATFEKAFEKAFKEAMQRAFWNNFVLKVAETLNITREQAEAFLRGEKWR